MYFVSMFDSCMVQVVSQSVSPQWKQGFAWAFDNPPKGQKLHIACKNKGAFGKVSSST